MAFRADRLAESHTQNPAQSIGAVSRLALVLNVAEADPRLLEEVGDLNTLRKSVH